MSTAYDIYLMPGLGLNHRIFENLSIQSGNVFALRWIEPLEREALETYVQRLSEQMKPASNPIILIGHSFGGVIVQELQKVVKVEKLILISTIISPQELPANLVWVKRFKLHHLIHAPLMRLSFPIWGGPNGYDSAYLKTLFLESTRQLSNHYFRWALENLVNWQPTAEPVSLLRIHGAKDTTFPYHIISQAVSIEDGDHLMVHKKGAVISLLIHQFLEKQKTIPKPK